MMYRIIRRRESPATAYIESSIIIMLYIQRFLTQFTHFRCEIPSCEGISVFNDTSWMNFSIPFNYEKDKLESCVRYAPRDETNETCSADAFYKNKTVPCKSFIYGESNTLVKEVRIFIVLVFRNMIFSILSFNNSVCKELIVILKYRYLNKESILLYFSV